MRLKRLCAGAVLLLAAQAMPGSWCLASLVPRTGFVTLQFDDTHDYDYTRILPRLEQHGLKGSFGYVTEISDLGLYCEPWKIQEIYGAGHEIQDHTTRHDYMWSTRVDTLDDGVTEWIPFAFASVEQWDSLCHRSRNILRDLGITAVGWNQPGGGCDFGEIPGYPGWASSADTCHNMYDVVASYYSYALGSGVYPNTAHLNLRGHNFPDRFPFFNVPHVTIDDLSFEDVKTGIADAVASGLWYLAVSHSSCLENVCKAESLIDWLADSDVEVLTCADGVQRIQWGWADPAANQLPQAAMLCDVDENGKPDGFAGDCVWDTLTAAPVEDARCLRVSGTAEFFCYGPELGTSGFSLWVRSATGAPCTALVAFAKFGFDWQWLGDTWVSIACPAEWLKVDSLYNQAFSIDVADEVDRIRYWVVAEDSAPVLVAYPELMRVPQETAGISGPGGRNPPRREMCAYPNPVRIGEQLEIALADDWGAVKVYDVRGRCLATAYPLKGQSRVAIATGGFAPGVLLVKHAASHLNSTKVVVYR